LAKYIVQSSGPLVGEVEISGSKNAVLPIMAAAILSEETCEILEVPHLKDVEVMCQLLRSIGATVWEDYPNHRVVIEPAKKLSSEAPLDLVNKMRASVLIMGPLLAKTGRAKMPLPGGCAIGERPIDLHLKGFEALGADVVKGYDFVEASSSKLIGTTIYSDFPSVGATENIMMAAVLGEGITIIENVAEEPEIVDLANFLNKMGARIKGAGTDTIKIEGVENLKGAVHQVIPDRIELGTFMVAAAITRGNITIKNALPSHVKPLIAKLKECGAEVEVTEDEETIVVRADVLPLVPADLKTLPYPGFPTDMQPQFMALLTTIKGASAVVETVFENRFMHVREMNRMGADIQTEGKSAIINGGRSLLGTTVMATDLRAGAALVLSALAAEGTTTIAEIHHIERGYSNLVEKLTGLGAVITRVED
jgi:UDP-N-acetylglucosamine 1-carboxyvinyltransferase